MLIWLSKLIEEIDWVQKKSKEKLKQKMMREGYLRVHAELARARREWHSQQANAFLARLKNFSLLSTLFLQT